MTTDWLDRNSGIRAACDSFRGGVALRSGITITENNSSASAAHIMDARQKLVESFDERMRRLDSQAEDNRRFHQQILAMLRQISERVSGMMDDKGETTIIEDAVETEKSGEEFGEKASETSKDQPENRSEAGILPNSVEVKVIPPVMEAAATKLKSYVDVGETGPKSSIDQSTNKRTEALSIGKSTAGASYAASGASGTPTVLPNPYQTPRGNVCIPHYRSDYQHAPMDRKFASYRPEMGVEFWNDELGTNFHNTHKNRAKRECLWFSGGKINFELFTDKSKLDVESELLADYVEVNSKHNDSKQYVWEPKVDVVCMIPEDEWYRGTKIRLHLRNEAQGFLDEFGLKDLVRKRFEFISYPIFIHIKKTTYKKIKDVSCEWDLVNKQKPIWMRKSNDGGLDVIETYVFWDSQEPVCVQYDCEGRNDFVKFVKLIKEASLLVRLHIGPYVCDEWNYGGFPLWLHFISGIELQTDNEPFKANMKGFTAKIVHMMKQENLYAPQGGPIILSQIGYGYGNIDFSYGTAAKTYINWVASMATSLNTVNWSVWFSSFGDPLILMVVYRPMEDLAFYVTRFYQLNYYMVPMADSSTLGVEYVSRLLQIQDSERVSPSLPVSTALNRIIPNRASSFKFSIILKDHCGGECCFILRNHPVARSVGGSPEILIRGTTGVETLSSLQCYPKYWCGVHITWSYYQNAVLSSYVFAWWDWERWEKEIDWMALHGINFPLAFIGQEAIWQKDSQNFNLSSGDLGDFFGSPTFLAWSRMVNLHEWDQVVFKESSKLSKNDFDITGNGLTDPAIQYGDYTDFAILSLRTSSLFGGGIVTPTDCSATQAFLMGLLEVGFINILSGLCLIGPSIINTRIPGLVMQLS